MATEWNDDDTLAEDEESDPGFVGGGGPAATIDGDDVAEGILDEHGENLASVDEDELGEDEL